MDHQVSELLNETDPEERFKRLADFVMSTPDAGVAVGANLLASPDPIRRVLGADVLGQAATVREDIPLEFVALVRSRLQTEQSAPALASAITAIGHLEDSESRPDLVRLSTHPDEGVRFAIAFALGSIDLDAEAIAVLEQLSRDVDSDVRDWATFALAKSDHDSDSIRAALLARTNDEDADTRAEAIYGLARRRDPAAAALLEREVAGGAEGSIIDRAREELTS